jgi:hypothetical protein
MTDLTTIDRAREERREWAERYRAADPGERAEMRHQRRRERETWKRLIASLSAPNQRTVVVTLRSLSWWERLLRRLRRGS